MLNKEYIDYLCMHAYGTYLYIEYNPYFFLNKLARLYTYIFLYNIRKDS